jgi:hypothetical protein
MTTVLVLLRFTSSAIIILSLFLTFNLPPYGSFGTPSPSFTSFS